MAETQQEIEEAGVQKEAQNSTESVKPETEETVELDPEAKDILRAIIERSDLDVLTKKTAYAQLVKELAEKHKDEGKTEEEFSKMVKSHKKDLSDLFIQTVEQAEKEAERKKMEEQKRAAAQLFDDIIVPVEDVTPSKKRTYQSDEEKEKEDGSQDEEKKKTEESDKDDSDKDEKSEGKKKHHKKHKHHSKKHHDKDKNDEKSDEDEKEEEDEEEEKDDEKKDGTFIENVEEDDDDEGELDDDDENYEEKKSKRKHKDKKSEKHKKHKSKEEGKDKEKKEKKKSSQKRQREDDHPDEEEEEDDIFRPKKKKEVQLTEEEKNKIASEFVDRMIQAYREDKRSSAEKRPALAKLQLLDEVEKMLLRSDLQESFLNNGVLEIMAAWLTPRKIGKKVFLPSIEIRNRLLKLLKQMKFDPALHKDTGIGYAVTVLSNAAEETNENRIIERNLIQQWSCQLYNIKTTIGRAPANRDDEAEEVPVRGGDADVGGDEDDDEEFLDKEM